MTTYKLKKSELSEDDYRMYLDNPKFKILQDTSEELVVQAADAVDGSILETLNE